MKRERPIMNSDRYKAVINDDKVALLHLQSVDTKDTPDVPQMSLCPGVLESEVHYHLSRSRVSYSHVHHFYVGNEICPGKEDDDLFEVFYINSFFFLFN